MAEQSHESAGPKSKTVDRVRSILVGDEVRQSVERFDGLDKGLQDLGERITGIDQTIGWLKGESLEALDKSLQKHLAIQARQQRAELDVEIASVRTEMESLRLRFDQIATMLHMFMETNADMAAKLRDVELGEGSENL
jgi:hypothetical protein